MKFFRRRTKISVYKEVEKQPLRIVGDAGIASGRLADGRLVPLVIVDAANRPDLEEFVRIHQHLPPGDAESVWAEADTIGRVALVIRFSRPVRIVAILEFEIVEQGILVDQIVTTKLLYLQTGRAGDRYITTVDAPRIFVEIGAKGFQEQWDKLWHTGIARKFRAQGLGRKQAKDAAKMAIMEMREVGKLRLRN